MPVWDQDSVGVCLVVVLRMATRQARLDFRGRTCLWSLIGGGFSLVVLHLRSISLILKLNGSENGIPSLIICNNHFYYTKGIGSESTLRLPTLHFHPHFMSTTYNRAEIEAEPSKIVKDHPKPIPSIIYCTTPVAKAAMIHLTRLNDACAVAGASWLMSIRMVLLH